MRDAWVLLLAALAVSSTTSTVEAQDSDDYTRYELLAPETARFRIVYEVTATTPGAAFYFNPIRKGSEASDEAVYDRASGKPLRFEVVDGASARAAGEKNADLDTRYIKVELPRPVPAGGELRLRIDKTYRDPKSYFTEGERVVFSRSLGVRRNAVVLPQGYELVACNVPAQVLQEPDGRIKVSFMNAGPDAASAVVKGRRLPAASALSAAPSQSAAPAPSATSTPNERPARLAERAHQDREIVYFLKPPETHAFELYHDVTETEGADRYLNVVRAGSSVRDPKAVVLDTGEALPLETLRGEAIRKAGVDIGEPVRAESEVVVIRFPKVAAGQTLRLRISETYEDAARYRLDGDELVFDRSFGRPRNAVVLPAGYALTNSSIPATVSETEDGRIRLDFVNPRPDEIAVLITAKKRTKG